MANPIIMPKLGQMTEESTVVRWLKQEGDVVAKGDILLEIETDKAVMEVESFYEGVLLKILVKEGETVPVMATLGFVGAPGEIVDEAAVAAAAGAVAETAAAAKAPAVAAAEKAPSEAAGSSAQPERFKISPRAAGLALAKGVDARLIQGSGPGGRIIERDVLAYLKKIEEGAVPATLVPPPPAAATAAVAAEQGGEPLSNMRRVIAQRLTQSYTTVPHFFATVNVDMGEIELLRDGLKADGRSVSITDFLIKAAALSLREFPNCNNRTDGRVVYQNPEVNIGMAVALEDGLVVPVIRNADKLDLLEISRLTKELATKARGGKLKPEEMTGSSFTISNLGMLNVDSFTAIINPGESAILAVSSTTWKPVVVDQAIEARPIMKMTLSSDHRLIDGALAARFLNALRSRLENGALWREFIPTSPTTPGTAA